MARVHCDELVFFVNGKKVTEPHPDPDATLLMYLRDTLRLGGTKMACGVGGCGACTVMVSSYDRVNKRTINKAVTSCLISLCAVHGCAVTTVEGVGSIRTGLHPIQARLVENHGIQCGFCTPGMVMSMYALLRTNPKPSRREIENALDGNLCRCTGYRSILQSVDSFSQEFTCGLGDKCCKKVAGKVETKAALKEASQYYQPYNPSQEPIFPSQLQVSDELDQPNLRFESECITWLRPTTLADFIELRHANPNAIIVGGFTHAGFQVRSSPGVRHVLLSVSGLKEAHVVEQTSSGITLGAGLTINDAVYALQEAIDKCTDYSARGPIAVQTLLKRFASQQIRNMATLGGSLQANYANSDVITPLIGAGASVVSTSSAGQMEVIPLLDMCHTGKYEPLANGSVLLAVNIPFTTQDQHVFTFKQSSRRAMDRAIVNASLSVSMEEGTNKVQKVILCFGGVGTNVMLAQETVTHMIGKTWDEELLESASMKLNEELITLIADNKKQYHRSLALGFLFTFYHAVTQQLQGLVADTSGCSADPSCLATQVWEETPPEQPQMDTVGRPKPQVTAYQMATGEALYYSDLPRREDELVLVLVRSTKAHAQIVCVDTSAALSMPGVVGYVGHEDVPGSNICGYMNNDEFIFAVDKVENVGQTIGGIVAKTEDQARQAAMAVKVTYKDIAPVILTIQEAINSKSFFPGSEFKESRGDTVIGMKEADHVKEGTIQIGAQDQFYMETQFACVVPVGKEDEYEVYLGSQSIADAQGAVAKTLDIPRNRITIRQKRIGGAFGGKETRPVISLTLNPAAVAAHKFQRPIRHHLARDEDITTTGGRHPYIINYKVGFKNDGKITAVEYNQFNNGGSDYDLSGLVAMCSVKGSEGAYRYPTVRSKVTVCKTNTPSPTAMRGFGRPQAFFASEHVMDHIAQTLGFPTEQVRDKNLLSDGDMPLYGLPVDGNLRRCWDELILQSDLKGKRQQQQEHNKNSRFKKRGMAAIPTLFAIGFPLPSLWQGGAQLLVYQDGSVLLAHGGIEMGQGINTKMIQIASRELGIPTDRIHTAEAGTNTVPNTIPTVGSAGTDLNGPAVMDACRKLKQRMDPIIKANPEGSWNEWVGAAFNERISLSATGFYTLSDKEVPVWTGCIYYTYGAACTEVEVDCLTGEHVVLQTDIVMDVGRSLNPGIDIGQIEGAFVMGHGLHTMEEILRTPDGTMTSRDADSYMIPTVKDTPRTFNVTLLKGADTPKPVYSSKGIGEPSLALGMSVFYAIKDAVTFARRDAGLTGYYQIDSPATVERIRMACTDKITKLVTVTSDYSRPDWSA